MADQKGAADRLPIKVVLPSQGREKRVSGGGSTPKPFRDVTGDFRSQLSRSVDAIRELALAAESKVGSIPVRVKLVPRARAKSHRPDELFAKTCPIVGAGTLGELFLRGSPAGLKSLSEAIGTGSSPKALKQISSIETIEPVTPHFRRKGLAPEEILRRSPRTKDGYEVRVRLFDFAAENEQDELEKNFLDECAARSLSAFKGPYSKASRVYSVECKSSTDVEALSKIVGVRSIARMPSVQMVRPTVTNVGEAPPDLPACQGALEDLPTVAVVDSGVSEACEPLGTWIVGRQSDVAPNERNTDHGTFVAGLITWGRDLNPHLKCIGEGPCAVFDMQVLPNNNPDKGDVGTVTEAELLQSLETALKSYANRFKVWNLSLGTDEVCSQDEFSAFAEQLDDLQEKYQVVFVISAGNFSARPFLDYPRKNGQLEAGRITTPADSVLGVTVGAVSHIAYERNGPRIHEPSPFSRHGAGPNHIIKPDLVHFGGTCSTDGRHIAGIRSIYGEGVADDLGTSFAAPLVARSLAQVMHQITPTPSTVLGRALLTHHARDPRSEERVPDGEENFFGFGMPAAPPLCLECTPHSSTLVFEDTLRPGFFLEWDDFPYPDSLKRDGKYFGEVWMTVALCPSRGARWGTEYCESHVDAHLGVFHEVVSRKTGEISTKFKGLVPPEHKNPGVLYESYQVERLRKWAPVRTYFGDISNGHKGIRWRLKVRLLTRHDGDEQQRPQPFALIVTVSDSEEKAPVYDEMARKIRTRFQAENLAVRPVVRVQTES